MNAGYLAYLAPSFGLILGAIFGSFIAALVSRWPNGKSVMAGRSQCDGCGKKLRPHELIPIISHILQRGKCRSCDATIDHEALFIELCAAAISGLALCMSPDWYGVAGAVFGWILLALAALDLRHYWLPDRLTLLLAVTGLIAVFIFNRGQITDHIAGGVAGFVLLWLIGWGYKHLRGREGLGSGDPKMLGGIGIWLGWAGLPFILLGASVLGLSIAAVLMLTGRKVAADMHLPLGALMALPAYIYWLVFN
ncbi:A24 family peptidase [Sphingorhabdus sp. Alg239-R122]|uniref:prepilin peptidase n=1 Tax=Sphingorhabdus sp. Alg239-R122 TaxID=2305989 RepID=UPI001F077ED7|nr:A24 family peptidase [Sphingorhabdus sp. Alg239-R122]